MSSAAQTTHDARNAHERPESPSTALAASGIKPLDHRAGGIVSGRPVVISGDHGTGKTVACLEFLRQGVAAGETTVLISSEEPADVLSSAAFLGVDLDRPLRDGRLVLLRYKRDFCRQLGRAATADGVFAELRRHLAKGTPSRVAIDSIVPLLDGGSASAHAIQSLVGFLDETRVTSLITFPGDLAGLCDVRLEPLIKRASGVFHLAIDRERNHRLEARKTGHGLQPVEPVSFRILAEAGMVVLDDAGPQVSSVEPGGPSRVVLLNLSDHLPNELVNGLRQHFEVHEPASAVQAFADVAHDGTGALLLTVRRDVFDSTLQLIRDLRCSNRQVPVVLITPYVLRSADRARALRAGADDFLATSAASVGAVARLRSIIRRGHRPELMSRTPEPGRAIQPSRDGAHYRPMPCDVLTKSVREYLDREAKPFFTLFLISPEKGDIGGFAKLAMKSVRVESGDLVCVQGKKVLAYLDSTRPKDLASLKARLRDHALRLGYGDIEIEALAFPAHADAVRAVLDAPSAHVQTPLLRKPREAITRGMRWT
jgi:archaellum biogenesis ATPase FlaH/CheY-like chemotaxis protein